MAKLFPEYCWKDTAFGDVNRRNNLIRVEELGNRLPSNRRECYATICRFPDEYREHVKKEKTVTGYKGPAYADTLWLDLDSKDLEQALSDAAITAAALCGQWGVHPDDLRIYFSGKKGFHVGIPVETFGAEPSADLPRALGVLAQRIADQAGVKLDPAIYKTNSLLRLPNTVNAKSGLYKIQLTWEELTSVEEIKERARKPRTDRVPPGPGAYNDLLANLWQNILETLARDAKTSRELPVVGAGGVSEVPRFDKVCMHRMMKGVGVGSRNEVALRLAVHLRQKGMPLSMAEAAILEWNRHNEAPLDEVPLLDTTRRAFENGYDFGCHDPILDRFCAKTCHLYKLKAKTDGEPEEKILTVSELRDLYMGFIRDRDKAQVTWGIPWIDEKTRKLAPGQVGFILARAGVGKTALTLTILKANSNLKIPSVFFSLEQLGAEIFERMAQQATDMTNVQIEEGFGTGDVDFIGSVAGAVTKEFSHAYVCTEDRLTIEQLKTYIRAAEEKAGEKIRLVVVDYLGRMKGDGRDAYQRMSELALGMKQVAKECECAVIVVAQANRSGGRGSVEVTMDMARDSGQIEEAADYIVGMWKANGDDPNNSAGTTNAAGRGIADGPGYFPVIVSILKNRKGESNCQLPLMFRASVMKFDSIDWRPSARKAAGEF